MCCKHDGSSFIFLYDPQHQPTFYHTNPRTLIKFLKHEIYFFSNRILLFELSFRFIALKIFWLWYMIVFIRKTDEFDDITWTRSISCYMILFWISRKMFWFSSKGTFFATKLFMQCEKLYYISPNTAFFVYSINTLLSWHTIFIYVGILFINAPTFIKDLCRLLFNLV